MSNLTDTARDHLAGMTEIPTYVWLVVGMAIIILTLMAWLTTMPTDEPHHHDDVPGPGLGQDCGDVYQPGVACRRPAGHPGDFHADGYGGTWSVTERGAA